MLVPVPEKLPGRKKCDEEEEDEEEEEEDDDDEFWGIFDIF